MNSINSIQTAHLDKVNSVILSSDFTFLISVSGDSISFWDTIKGMELAAASGNITEDSVVLALPPAYQKSFGSRERIFM